MTLPPKDPGYRTTIGHLRYLRELKRWRAGLGQGKEAAVNSEIDQIIKRTAEAAASADARIMVGDYWITLLQVAGDGREQYAIFDPNGQHLTNLWGKEAAEAAVFEHIEKGTISR
jgi:hypothetical protein